MTLEEQYLEAARCFAVDSYNSLMRENNHGSHISFEVREALLMTEKQFPELETYGVESISESNGFELCYLNTGDTYKPTICFDWSQLRFVVASWGGLAESFGE